MIWAHRREAGPAVEKLIQFSRIDLRFSGCGKTLKENCLLQESLKLRPKTFKVHTSATDHGHGIILGSGRSREK